MSDSGRERLTKALDLSGVFLNAQQSKTINLKGIDFFRAIVPVMVVNPTNDPMDFIVPERLGTLKVILTENPDAGDSQLTHTVPIGLRWNILSIRMVLTTEETVADRTVRISFGDSARTYFKNVSGAVQTATSAKEYFFVPGYGFQETSFDLNGDIRIALPSELTMIAGDIMTVGATNFQTGAFKDDWGQGEIRVEEFVTED